MTELKSLLEAFARGEASFEALSAAVERTLAATPERAPELAQALRAARDAGLPHHVFVALSSKLDATNQPEPPSPEPSFGDTVVLQAPLRHGRGKPKKPPAADATVLAPREDAPKAPAAPRARDADATVLAPADGSDRTAVTPAPRSRAEDTRTPPTVDFELDSGTADATVFADEGAADVTRVDGGTLDADVTRLDTDSARGHEVTDLGVTKRAGQDRDAIPEGTEKTRMPGAGGGTADTLDVFAPEPTAGSDRSTREPSQTGASWPTSGATDGLGSPHGGAREFGAGDVLRGRFRLISKLGEGGMGAVWKAIDLLKEEAQDRNPFVAVKLLVGDFKQHPESFIALQRESAKAQRLAHPNIATVFDFDRGEGGTVYMTMEVLEGTPLNAFIRKLPAGGLTYEEAMQVIEQLAAGLRYAHERGLVHCDLKPGNCFLTKEGVVKLLDFGIARASKTRTDESGETTKFDPGQLGALTPAYASIEMFEALDPDPRDDIYALACIAYELFTGKHPFGKKSAPKARELGLVAQPIPKLNKRQNRGIQRGLAFLREERTPSIDDFLDDLTVKKSYAPQIAAGTLALVVLIGALAYKPIQDYLDNQRNQGFVTAIASGDPPTILANIETVRGFEPETQRAILDAEPARKAIVELYRGRAAEAFNPAQQRYDFPAAEGPLRALKALYPDSAQVLLIEGEFKSQRDAELARLDSLYNELLDQGRLLPDPQGEDIGDVLAVVGQIDPQSLLLQDKQLPIRYTDLAREAIEAKDYERAKAVLDASVAYAPDDPALSNLRFQVDSELRRIRNQARIAEVESRLRAERPRLRSLTAFQAVRDDLFVLADLSPESPVLNDLQSALRKAFGAEFDNQIKARAWDSSEQLLVDFAKLMTIPFLTEQRARLSRAEQEAGFTPPMTDARRAAVRERAETVDALLADPQLTGDWELALQVPYKELIALLPDGDPELEQLRTKTADLFLERARTARADSRFAEALAYVDRGLTFYPGFDGFRAERDAIAAAEEALRRQQEEARRLARLDGLKRTLQTVTQANQIDEALKIFAELEAGLPADDPFIARTGPELIAGAYLRNAEQLEKDGNWSGAVKLVEQGLALAPGLPALKEASARLRPIAAALASYSAFEEAAGAWPMRASAAELERLWKGIDWEVIRTALPADVEGLRQRAPRKLVANIEAAATARAEDVQALAAPLQALQRLFPDSHRTVAERLDKTLAGRIEDLARRDDVRAHNALLEAANRALPGARLLAKLSPLQARAESKLAAEGLQQVRDGKLNAAEATLARVERDEPRALNLTDLREALAKARTDAQKAYDNFRAWNAQRPKGSEAKAWFDQARKLWSDRQPWKDEYEATFAQLKRGACSTRLAGLGKNNRATCYDELGGGERGPVLVVVPGGGGVGKPFAIGKYEVSIADWNTYCKQSGQCQPKAGDGDLPVTGVSAKDVDGYARWLSQATGAVYRLPTDSEWDYAAQAGGAQPAKDFNCTVVQGASKLKGFSLVSVKAGKPNGWGLTNYVGNAQELARSGAGVVARGGAFEDPLSRCEISLSRGHNGAGDAVTGFRLLREMG